MEQIASAAALRAAAHAWLSSVDTGSADYFGQVFTQEPSSHVLGQGEALINARR